MCVKFHKNRITRSMKIQLNYNFCIFKAFQCICVVVDLDYIKMDLVNASDVHEALLRKCSKTCTTKWCNKRADVDWYQST